MATAAAPVDADDLAFDPPLASTRTLTPSPPTTVGGDVCLICLEALTPQPTPASSTSSLSEPLLSAIAAATTNTVYAASPARPTLVAIATQPPTARCGCKYRVHPACLQAWFAHRPVCPMCRTGMEHGVDTDGDDTLPHTPGDAADAGMVVDEVRLGVLSPQSWGRRSRALQRQGSVEEAERTTCCCRLLCVCGGLFIVYVILSVFALSDSYPVVVNGTAGQWGTT